MVATAGGESGDGEDPKKEEILGSWVGLEHHGLGIPQEQRSQAQERPHGHAQPPQLQQQLREVPAP